MLTQEDWNIVLFAGMERTSHWAALYFVALMTFGNYVLFNLLVAILVEGFKCQNDLFAEAYSEMEDFYSGSEIESDFSSDTNLDLEDKRKEGWSGNKLFSEQYSEQSFVREKEERSGPVVCKLQEEQQWQWGQV